MSNPNYKILTNFEDKITDCSDWQNDQIKKVLRTNELTPEAFKNEFTLDSNKMLSALNEIIKNGVFSNDKLKLVELDRLQLFPKYEIVKHYFLLTDDGVIIDVFNWVSDMPILYEGYSIVGADSGTARTNPSGLEFYEYLKEPFLFWFSVHLAFLGDRRAELKEDTLQFIERVFQDYKKQGKTRKDALSEATETAESVLIKKEFLDYDGRRLTEKGIMRQETLIKQLGFVELQKRFEEYETILECTLGG